MKSRKLKLNRKLLLPNILIALIGFAGLAISIYLTYIHYANAKSFCDLSETISCDVVTTSIYSEIFGLPVSILGIAYFGTVLVLSLIKESSKIFKLLFLLSIFVLMPSLYLTGIEAFVIQAFCPLCETSKVLMALILLISYFQIKEKPKELIKEGSFVLFVGIVAAAVTFFAQTGNVTKEDYSQFAQALTDKGVVYYKSIKCNNCKRQEKIFGKAYEKLSKIECHPDGPDPKPELCLKMGISKTPTFLIEQDGKELKRLEGLNKLEDIAKWADVPF